MATLTNTIKKATKFNNGVAPKYTGCEYVFVYKGYEVSFHRNGREDSATCFYTKRKGDKDDIITDYFCGTFHDNLTQAVKFIDCITAYKN